MSKVIHRLVSDKAEPLLYPVLDKVIERMRTTANHRGRAVEVYAGEKLRMLQAVKDSSENAWVRRALGYGLRKIKITDDDLKGNVDVYELLKQRAISALKEAVAPNKTVLWVLVLLQLVFAVIIAFL
ncbi:hypothetical protein [Flavobacterium sp.]|uniref:hypothetical protein n=1 Tax=Flavobacterium sp. TaxID=239 RepID=UPI00403482E5